MWMHREKTDGVVRERRDGRKKKEGRRGEEGEREHEHKMLVVLNFEYIYEDWSPCTSILKKIF